jgi:hypothetical protein
MIEAPTLVLYHADCPDGFGAAWAYWKRWGDRARYVPISYDQVPLPEVTGEDVVMVDVSAPADRLHALNAQARSFRLLDHHESAEQELAALPFATFDLSRSGAALGWNDAFPGVPLPRLVRYIQDRDLGRPFEPGARECLLVLDSLLRNFAAWDAFAQRLEHDLDGVRAEGRPMAQQYDAFIARFVRQAVPVTLAGVPALIVNVPHIFATDVGLSLAQETPLGLTWYLDGASQVHLSLRGHKSHFNVIPVAEGLKGGGHRDGAGARLTLDALQALYRGEDILAQDAALVATMAQWQTRWQQRHAVPASVRAAPPRPRCCG